MKNHTAIVDSLLKSGADPNIKMKVSIYLYPNFYLYTHVHLYVCICYIYVLILVALNRYIRSASSASDSATASWCTDASLVQTCKRTNTDATSPQIRKFCFKFRNREVVNAFRRMKEEVQVFLLLSLSLSLSLFTPPSFC